MPTLPITDALLRQLLPQLNEALHGELLQRRLATDGQDKTTRCQIIQEALTPILAAQGVALGDFIDQFDLGLLVTTTDAELTHALLSLNIQLQVLKRLPLARAADDFLERGMRLNEQLGSHNADLRRRIQVAGPLG